MVMESNSITEKINDERLRPKAGGDVIPERTVALDLDLNYAAPSNLVLTPAPECRKLSRGISRATDNEGLVWALRSNTEPDHSPLSDHILLLPDISVYPPDFRIYIEKDLLETATLVTLESANILNWWRTGRVPGAPRLLPLATSGDGNCLPHAASLAAYGFHDRLLALRTKLQALLSGENGEALSKAIERRWRWSESQSLRAAGLRLSEAEWRREWADAVRAASAEPRPRAASAAPHYAALEHLHVFALAHVMRRPVIVFADVALRDYSGEPVAPIPFGGIYLPLELPPSQCGRCPVLLAYDAGHFSALVPTEPLPRDGARVPLEDHAGNHMPIRFNVDPGDDFNWDEEPDQKTINNLLPDEFQRNAMLAAYLDLETNKSKATWKVIQNNYTKKESYNNITKIRDKDNNIVSNPVHIASAFNNYFIGHPEDRLPKNPKKKFDAPFTPHSMFMYPTTDKEIIRYIMSLKNTNSTGNDNISTKVIKFVAPIIAPILAHLTNLCMSQGQFPNRLKVTIIKPLYKKNDKMNIENYRPIALVSVLSKIIEKAIYERLYNYFHKFNLFSPQQMGFRKNCTINVAIFNFLRELMENVDKGYVSCALYMDLKKAFDFVNHEILIAKLYQYGIRGSALELIKSYLKNRLQYTCIQTINFQTKSEELHYSELKYIFRGVPQGSVLGPLFFIIYINDFPLHIKIPMTIFADDCNLLFFDDGRTDIEMKILNTLIIIIEWLKENELNLNFDKTKIMTFVNKNKKRPTLNIKYNNHAIEEITETKFLGLLVDNDLSWNSHIEILCTKLQKFSYALYMLAKVVGIDALLITYNAYVASILRYGIVFWGNATENERVFRAQKRCIRSMCGLKQTESCQPYFKKFKILTLPCLYIYESILFLKKYNIQMYENFKSMRHKNKLKIPLSKTYKLSKSAYIMMPKLYNKLPTDIKEIDNHYSFKNKLFKFLIDKNFYSVAEYLNDKYN